MEVDSGKEYLAVRPQGTDANAPLYKYEVTYGGGGCAAHDKDQAPFCSGPFQPAWCSDAWCYVDKDNCDKVHVRSKYFGQEDLYYSYGACSESNSFQKWFAGCVAETKDQSEVRLGALIELVEGYVRSNKVAAETTPADVGSCGVTQQACPCTDCSESGEYWPSKKVSFNDMTMLPGSLSGSEDDGTCLGNAVSTTYLNMAAKEYDDRTRVGYQYFGHQTSGGYGQWPLTDLSTSGDMCDSYDPRFRPWYASTATGPKDLVLVLARC